MRLGWILIAIAFIALFALQIAGIHSLPGGLYFNLLAVILVFYLVLFGWEKALPWFLFSGFLFDIFSFKLFGFYMLLFAVILILVYWLLTYVLTNRSLYSFLLLIAAVMIVYDVAVTVAFNLSWQNFFIEELRRLGANFLLTVVGFYLVSYFSYRLRPVFLVKNK